MKWNDMKNETNANARLVYDQVQFMDQWGDCGFLSLNNIWLTYQTTILPSRQANTTNTLSDYKLTYYNYYLLTTETTTYTFLFYIHIHLYVPHTDILYITYIQKVRLINWVWYAITGTTSGCQAGGRCDNIQRFHTERLRRTRWAIAQRHEYLVHVLMPLYLSQWEPA